MTKKTLISAVAIVILFAGCTEFSPISGKQVTFDQLMQEWTDFKDKELKIQDCCNKEILKANDLTQAAKNDIQSSFFGYVLQFLDDPSNSGIGVTLGTAALTVLTGGLHLNNLRLNRKIALPEVDDDDDEDDATDKPAAAVKPMTMADLAILGAFGAVSNS